MKPLGSTPVLTSAPARFCYPRLTAEEAAELIPDGAMIGFSGFTPAGAAKAVPRALAARARAAHAAGQPLQFKVLTGASTGSDFDEAMAEADAIAWRAPYQSSPALRQRINAQQTQFLDLHLSSVAQAVDFGFIPAIDVAVVEACEITADGRVYLSTSSGISPTILRRARYVIIELNRYHTPRLAEMHDVAILQPPPHRSPIPIYEPLSKMGMPFATVDPRKVVGVVENHQSDGVRPFCAPDAISERIAGHVVQFLIDELQAGRIPPQFLPLQSGVGNVANAVMAGLGHSDAVPPFYMFTEVFQDACVELMERGQMLGASTTALTLSDPQLQRVYAEMDFFAPRIVIRPQELSNHPGVVRRLGVIAINTALEVDIYGHVNSTHVCGTQLMNGIGGSGDFIRNAYLSIFVCPSVAKNGAISAIVPMATHVDHSEHSVDIIVTEQGLADTRGLGPMQRAERIIQCCAHPMYRDELMGYLHASPGGHLRHDLLRCFEWHRRFLETGHMLAAGAGGLPGS